MVDGRQNSLINTRAAFISFIWIGNYSTKAIFAFFNENRVYM